MREDCFVWLCETKRCCYLVAEQWLSGQRDLKGRSSPETHKNNYGFPLLFDPTHPSTTTAPWYEQSIYMHLALASIWVFTSWFLFPSIQTHAHMQLSEILAGISLRQWRRNWIKWRSYLLHSATHTIRPAKQFMHYVYFNNRGAKRTVTERMEYVLIISCCKSLTRLTFTPAK